MLLRKCYSGCETNPARLRQGILCTEILPGPKKFIRKPGRIKKEKNILITVLMKVMINIINID